MARAQFQKGQKVWVECVGAWATIEKVQPVWAKGFEEPVRVTYDVGLGREFAASELMTAAEDGAGRDLGVWRVLRARNKWQAEEDCLHHPQPGTYPVVVTDTADWGGWRVPGAEYDRDPQRIEFQARLITAAPQLMRLAESLIALAAEAPEDAPPAVLDLARQARSALHPVVTVAQEAQTSPQSPAVAA
ncbi:MULTISPECIES: hypothetical protein [Brevundimonas]|jgi:hypothetical protein|uniref:Uncharacterized protein n=1 Tax=Brevundimonas aurantiaca TaxID=74316 RepID=A0A7W9F962_9CAUL|nr:MULTISPECIES: hypothetical protein [Brevundimonas]KAK0362172.1 hypothetical protein LTR94_020506 [Friedmanniomyces endolithicus]MBB5739048.1 hypothetical protein [Brevundimonas aurantiaca]MBJ7511866.1 hypothetical protein [Brevundimonas sp.]